MGKYRGKRKRDGVDNDSERVAKKRKIDLTDSPLQTNSVVFKNPSEAFVSLSFNNPKLVEKRKHKTAKVEICGELWMLWVYVNHPKTKKKKTRKGYLSIYLEMVDGKQRPHDFWARVNFQVTARHKSDASLDIKKNSTMFITRYDASRGFREVIKWSQLDHFIRTDEKIQFEVSLKIRTTLINDNIVAQSPLIFSDLPYVVKQGFTSEDIERIHDMPAIAQDKYKARQMRRDFGSDSKKYGDTNGHSVVYIQDALRDFAPKVFDKIYDVVNVHMDRWTKRPKECNLGIKRVEYIKYKAGKEEKKGDWIGWHTDTDVRLVMSLMLTNTSEFVGGIFQAKTPESEDFPLSYRDCVLFPGQIVEHRVTPITKGTRCVLIVEFWDKRMQSIERSYEEWDSSSSDSSD